MELAKCQIDILFEIRNKPILYSNDELSSRLEGESDFEFLISNELIDYNVDERTNKYLVEITPLGKIEVERYQRSLENEAKEDKRWKHTSLIAWIGVGISIIALVIAMIKN